MDVKIIILTVFLFTSLQLLIFFLTPNQKLFSCWLLSVFVFHVLLSALKRHFYVFCPMCGVGTRFMSLYGNK